MQCSIDRISNPRISHRSILAFLSLANVKLHLHRLLCFLPGLRSLGPPLGLIVRSSYYCSGPPISLNNYPISPRALSQRFETFVFFSNYGGRFTDHKFVLFVEGLAETPRGVSILPSTSLSVSSPGLNFFHHRLPHREEQDIRTKKQTAGLFFFPF